MADPTKKPKRPKKQTSSPKASSPPDSDQVGQVLQANGAFYRALTSGSFEAMVEVWAQRPDCMCVHPSGIILRGWDKIFESWEKIFQGGSPKVIPESEEVTLVGDSASVFCVERIISEAGMGLAGATNVFAQGEDGSWKMLWHHSSLLPNVY